MDTFETFCCHLASAIKASGYSRAEIAETLGVKPATVKSWCVGRRSPTVQRLLALCEVLGVEPVSLFTKPEAPFVRKECVVCGRSFRREVGYRIHLALRAREDPGHRSLNEEAEKVPA